MTEAPQWPVEVDYPRDLFHGTADYYARYRPPYPPALFDDLLSTAPVTPGARLLDLACGTGHAALPLADRFSEVWAVDLEPDMIEVGRRTAATAGLDNIRWLLQPAEEVDAPAGHFRLVTVGNAFHRLHRPLIAQLCLQWIEPGGYLAVLFGASLWIGDQPWQRAAEPVITKWTSPDAIIPASVAGGPRLSHEQVLIEAGFVEVAESVYPTPHVWTVDTFIGYLRSAGFLSDLRQSGLVERFEDELRAALLTAEPSGELSEDISFSLLLGRRPG
jgi:SAM-dependent methyltransferase